MERREKPRRAEESALDQEGDSVFFYHTGDEKSVVGIAKATSDAYLDPADKTGKAHVFDLAR